MTDEQTRPQTGGAGATQPQGVAGAIENGAFSGSEKAPSQAEPRANGREVRPERARKGAYLFGGRETTLKTYSTKQASRRLAEVLAAAQDMPVIVERHGRPHAVVMSIQRFEIGEKLVRQALDEMGVALLNESIDTTRNGKLRLATRLRLKSQAMAGLGK